MEQLKQTLTELHQTLSEGESLDAETTSLLRQLGDDIDKLLEKSADTKAESDDAGSEKQSLLDQMLDLTEQFEESHPALAETIGRVASALSRIGI